MASHVEQKNGMEDLPPTVQRKACSLGRMYEEIALITSTCRSVDRQQQLTFLPPSRSDTSIVPVSMTDN